MALFLLSGEFMRNESGSLRCVAVLALLGAWTTHARAEYGHVGLEAGYAKQDTDHDSRTVGVLALDVALRPRNASVEFTLVAPFWSGATAETSMTRMGNVALGAHYFADDDTSPLSGRVGLEVSLPTANIDKYGEGEEGDLVALAKESYGMRNAWWFWSGPALLVAGDLEYRTGPLFLLADSTLLVLPLAFNARAGMAFGNEAVNGGVKLGALLASWTYVSAEPFVRFSLFDTVYGEASMTINLDEPIGFAFDKGGVWGLHFGVGARF